MFPAARQTTDARSGLPRKPEEVQRATATYKAEAARSRPTAASDGHVPRREARRLRRPAAVHQSTREPTSFSRKSLRGRASTQSPTSTSAAQGADHRWAHASSGATRRTTGRSTGSAARRTSSEAPAEDGNRLVIAERGRGRSPRSHRRTISSGRARRVRTSATTGIARTATRHSRSASGRRERRRAEDSRRTSRSTARGPARCSTCRSSSTSAPTPPKATRDAVSPSRTAIASSRSPATR